MFALGGILKLFGDLFALIGPLAIQQIVQYIEGLYAQARAQVERGGLDANPNAATDAVDVPVDAPVDVPIYYDNDDVDVDNGGGPFGLAIGVGQHCVRIYYASWSDLLTNGWSIAWLVLLAALAQAALSQASTHVLNMTGIRIKTSLQGLIYRKSLLLNAGSAAAAGCGDADGGNPTASVGQRNGDIVNASNAQQQQQRQAERSSGECLALYNSRFVAVPHSPRSAPLAHPSPNPKPTQLDIAKCAFGVN